LLPVGPAPLAGRMAGIDAFIERHLQLDMPRLDRTAERRLLELAADADVDIAAVALAALHYARGNDSRIRDRLVSRLATTGSRDAALRRRWTVVLGFLADRERGKGNAEAAVRIYRKALELEPAHPHLLLNLGLALMDAGDVGGAIEAYRRSIDVDPAQPLVFVNLGVALESRDAVAAAEAFRRAVTINPFESIAWFNLGNSFLRQGDAATAAQFYRQAIQLDPALVPARFNLARVLASAGDLRAALAEVETGLRFAPGDAEGQELRAQLMQASR
jgi:Flp pilus assembly protein TadD